MEEADMGSSQCPPQNAVSSIAFPTTVWASFLPRSVPGVDPNHSALSSGQPLAFLLYLCSANVDFFLQRFRNHFSYRYRDCCTFSVSSVS